MCRPCCRNGTGGSRSSHNFSFPLGSGSFRGMVMERLRVMPMGSQAGDVHRWEKVDVGKCTDLRGARATPACSNAAAPRSQPLFTTRGCPYYNEAYSDSPESFCKSRRLCDSKYPIDAPNTPSLRLCEFGISQSYATWPAMSGKSHPTSPTLHVLLVSGHGSCHM